MMKFCKKCQTETERGNRGQCKPCVRARSAAWLAANREKKRARRVARYAADPDKERAANAAWNAAHRDKVLAVSVAWRAANLERARVAAAAWSAANPERRRIHGQNRRSRKMAVGGKLSPGLAAKLYKLQRGKCACGCKQQLGTTYHMDHIMPLALGGTNTDDNMQLLTATCNLQKSTRHPVDFMQQRGFLL